MPHMIRILLRALLCASALWASATWAEEAAVPAGDARQGTFKSVQGEVQVLRADTTRNAAVGGALLAADRVRTGPKSAAAITLKDGTVLSIGPQSMVELSQFSFNSTTQDGNLLVMLLNGSLRMVTGLIAKTHPEQVKVTTPTTVIGVRGTDFIVEQKP